MKHIPRFFYSQRIDRSDIFLSPEQMYHANKVLRLAEDDEIRVFNQSDGEWSCVIKSVKKNIVAPIKQIVQPREEQGATIACALINPHRFAILAEKVTELGATRIVPIITDFTQYKTINRNKVQQTIIQACEQSRRLSIPELDEPISLRQFLEQFPVDKNLYVGMEDSSKTKQYALTINIDSCFLIGPEGGFSANEIAMFSEFDFIQTLHLGCNILRSETAAIAFAVLCVQQCG